VQLLKNLFFEILLEWPFFVSQLNVQNQDYETFLQSQAVDDSGSLLCLFLDRSYTITPTKPIPNKMTEIYDI
jgi:hypothetical protein